MRDVFQSRPNYGAYTQEKNHIALDLRNPSSILSCVFAARENARMVRDQISLEMWETINDLYLFLRDRSATDVWKGGPYDFFQQIKRQSHLFQGLTDATFSRSACGYTRPDPGLGEHTFEVLSDYGIDPDRIASLADDGVVMVLC